MKTETNLLIAFEAKTTLLIVQGSTRLQPAFGRGAQPEQNLADSTAISYTMTDHGVFFS